MNQESFKKYLGRYIQIGVPRIGVENSLFFHSGILQSINEDGILLLSQKDEREVFIRYDRILEYNAPSGSGAWKKK